MQLRPRFAPIARRPKHQIELRVLLPFIEFHVAHDIHPVRKEDKQIDSAGARACAYRFEMYMQRFRVNKGKRERARRNETYHVVNSLVAVLWKYLKPVPRWAVRQSLV